MKIFDYADLGGKHSWDYTMNGITPENEGIKPILVTDEEINIGDVLVINDIAYSVCSLSGKAMKYQTAYVERLENQRVFVGKEEPKDINYSSEITCPYCGSEFESWEMDDEDDEYECGICKCIFSYQREVTVEYCSQPVRKVKPRFLHLAN